jgi:type IV pilus assembly PilO-like protein
MTARLAGLSGGKQVGLVVAGLVLAAVVGYFLLISPKRSQADELKAETAKVQVQIASSRSSAFVRALPAVRSADAFSLTKAIPDDVAMANVMLELNQLAVDSGITFDEITPQAPTGDASLDVQPITLAFSGNFYTLSDFLFRVRNLVRVENGKLLTRGRMFAVSGVKFTESDKNFPNLTANLVVDTFVLSKPAPVAPTTAVGTEAATTTTTPTTATASQPASGAPSTPVSTS